MKAAADALLHADQANYLAGLEPARDALLTRMEARAKERGYPISDPEVAAFLFATTRAMARRPLYIVELGTNIGYGAIVLARAGGEASRVLTVELDPGLCTEARAFVKDGGLDGRIEVREGKALDVLATIERPIDVAYVDCVKEEYPAYLELIVPRLAQGGVVIADNVLWKGLVARAAVQGRESVPEKERPRTDAIAEFNRRLLGDPRLRGVVLPLGDGVAYGVRVA